MNHLLHTLLLFLMTLGVSHAQLQLKSVGHASAAEIDLHFKFRNYQLSRIQARQSFLKQMQPGNYRLELTLPNNQSKIFVLSEVALLADEYVETLAADNTTTKTGRASVKTFIGHQQNGISTITATIDDNFFTASVRGEGQSWHIEQVSSFKQCEPDLLVTYNEADILEDDLFKCGVEEVKERSKLLSSSADQARIMSGNCIQIRLAIAADSSMFGRYGSVSAVRNRILSTMNEVASIYRQQFVNNLEFKIVSLYISETYNQDPLSPNTREGTGVLSAFRRWAYTNQGFGVAHDMGQLWTARTLTGGVAWGDVSTVNWGICNRNAYHVLTDEEGRNVKKRVTHEIGHNFGALHDAEQNHSGYIMSAGYNPGLEWSDASRASINNYLSSSTATGCLLSCPEGVTPGFEMMSAGACVGNSIQFTDRSVNGTSDRLWQLEGGNPSEAIGVSPVIAYSSAGLYDVKLTSSGNSLLRKDYVFVSNQPKLTQTNCNVPTGDSGGGGIRMIGLNGTFIFPTKQDSVPKYVNRSCRYIIGLESGTNYDFVAKIGSVATETNSQIREHLKIYIDYNNDGLFNETNELVVKSPGVQGTSLLLNEENSRPWLNFTTPSAVIENTFLRMRVISDNIIPASSCHNPQTGQVKDFAVVFRKQDALPVKLVYFKAFRQEQAAKLEWETASELNSDRFEVECSSDLRNWIKVGSIRSHGESNQPARYQLMDTTVHSGIVYYRLRMIDGDGSFTYSSIQSVTFDRKGLVIHPNPTREHIFFSDINGAAFPSSEIQEVSIKNLAGITVHIQKSPISSNRIAVGHLTNGIYFVKLSASNGIQSTHKLIIAR